MSKITRREALSGLITGGSVVLLAPSLPGCAGRVPPPAAPAASAAGGAAASQGGAVAEMQSLFGVDGDMARKVLGRALQSGGEFADLFLEHRISDSLKLEEEKVDVASAEISMGGGVRVVVGDQAGYAYSDSLGEADLLRAAASAALIARGKARGAPRDFAAVPVAPLYPVKREPTEVPVPDKMALLRRLDRAARQASSLVQVVIAFSQCEQRRVLLYSSDGRVCADRRPYANLGVMVTVKKGERSERNWFSEGGMWDLGFYDGGRPEAIAAEAVKRATLCLDAVVPPAGELPVVLAAGDSGILLHEAVGHGLEADFNRKKISIYAGQVGQKVASELCTIVDDGTVAHSRGALAVDDEGRPGQRTVLIEKGVLRGYLHDEISTRQMKAAATGNGRRESYRHPPIPRMTTTFMLAGPHGEQEVFEGIERGVYAIDFTNGQVNIGAGDYTFFVNYGYLIEKGKVTRPIKDVNLIGNGPESMRRVERVSGELKIPHIGAGYCGKGGQRVPVSFGLPLVRLSKVTVGGRSAGGAS